MHLAKLSIPAAALLAMSACKLLEGLPDITLGADQDIPPISGSTTIDVPEDFACGQDIADPEGKYTITSSGTAQACTFLFEQDVLVLSAEDYADHPELEGAQMVKRIDIDVNAFALQDGATGAALVPDTLNGKAFGVTILTKADLQRNPPFTKTIAGAPINELKDIIAAQDDLVIPVDVEMVVNLTPAPPGQIALTYDAQPNLVFGF